MNRIPLLPIVAALIVGILVGTQSEVAPRAAWCIALMGTVLMAVLMAVWGSGASKKTAARTATAVAAVGIAWAAIGIVLTQYHDPMRDPAHYLYHCGTEQTIAVQLQLKSTPEERTRKYRCQAEVEQIKDEAGWHRSSGKVMLYVDKDSTARTLAYGDRIIGVIQLRQAPQTIGADGFNYRRYLQRQGIMSIAHLRQCGYTHIAAQQKGPIGWCHGLQQTLVERLKESGLSKSQKGIAEALLLGWRSDLSEDTQEQYRQAGITHLLCVSGLHVGIVAGMAGWLLSFIGGAIRLRMVKGVVQLVVIWLFVGITGLAPSTVRAGIMFSLLVAERMVSRGSNSMNSMLGAALLLLMAEPLLVYDIGFQLSFAAVTSILLLYPPLRGLIESPKRKESHKGRKRIGFMIRQANYKVWELLCLTTAAQIGTLPFQLYHFHQFAPYFMIANMVVVPFAGVLLLSTLSIVALGWWEWGCQAATHIVALELQSVDRLTQWIGVLPNSMIAGIYYDLPMMVMSLVAIGCLTLLVKKRRLPYLTALVFVAVVMSAYRVIAAT